MLQDLDSLLVRIQQLVDHLHTLKEERASLRARVKFLEEENSSLNNKLARLDEEHKTALQNQSQHQSQIEQIKGNAQNQQQQLQLELEDFRDKYAKTQQSLNDSQLDVKRLTTVSDAVKRQIDSILERLPGAQG